MFERIYIEISNICNLQCDFCPEVERVKNVMPPEFFQYVLGECRGLTKEVALHLMGEPMNHPQFAEIVSICARENLPVQLTTNGTLLRDSLRREALFSPAIRQVNFSLQSLNAQARPAAESSRRKYLESIFAFVHEAFARRPDLYINFRLWNVGAQTAAAENEEFVSAIEHEFGVPVDSPEGERGFRKSRRLVNRLYVHFDSRFEWPSLSAPVRQTMGSCHALKSHIGVLSDGTVVPCCLDKEAVIRLGRLQAGETGLLKRILASERAQKIRSEFDKGRVCEDLCRRCQYIERFATKHSNVSQPLRRSPAQLSVSSTSQAAPRSRTT